MAINIGNNSLSAAKLGTTNISSIWLGDVKLWPTIVYYKFQAEYSDGTSYNVECDGNGTLGTSQTKPSGYEYSAMTEAIIGDCVSGISSYSFESFINLSSVTMSSSVTQLGNSCFSTCVNLSNITISENITSIGDNCFNKCTSLSNITLPTGITYLGGSCFNKCTSLSNITLPTGITYLGGSCFYNCSSLSSIIIPSKVRNIGASCFSSCSSLSSVTIPSSVTYLGSACFGSCSSLSSVTIPSSVTRIDSYAFAYCTSLQSITVEATTPPTLGSSAFNSTNNCPIYVPCQSLDTYKSATNWSTYASRIEAIPNSCVSCNWKIMSEGDGRPFNYVNGIRISFGTMAPEGAYIGFEDDDGNIIEVAYDIYDDSWFMQYPSGSEQLVFDGDYAEVNFSDYGVGDATVTNSSIPFECILCIVP